MGRRRKSRKSKESSGAYSGREQWQVSWISWVVLMPYKQWVCGMEILQHVYMTFFKR